MFDMDGVLCDYVYWREFNHAIKENGKTDFGKIISIGSLFWANMPWLDEGQRLYNYVHEYVMTHSDIEIGIHSAVHLCCGKIGKQDWVRKNCPDIDMKNVKIDDDGHFKHITGAVDEILVDDRKENVKDYLDAGYPAVLFTTAGDTFMNVIKLIGQ